MIFSNFSHLPSLVFSGSFWDSLRKTEVVDKNRGLIVDEKTVRVEAATTSYFVVNEVIEVVAEVILFV
jgi:hypothetical protein